MDEGIHPPVPEDGLAMTPMWVKHRWLKPAKEFLISMLPVLFLMGAIIFLAIAVSCSPSKQIAQRSQKIAEISRSSEARFLVIGEEAASSQPNMEIISAEAAAGAGEQRDIQGMTGDISTLVTQVKDITPWWADLIGWVAIAASILGIGFLLWYLGIGSLLRAIFSWVPRRKRREAELAAKALDADSEVSIREAIAARRASDPDFDRAFVKANKERNNG